MRKLLYSLIVHNQADLGSFKERLSIEGERRYGRIRWEAHLKQVQESWDRTEEIVGRFLNTNNVPKSKVRVYQDGLPVAGEIGLKIVREGARRGSKNYQILENLVDRGACLEEADSRELLLQEHNYLSKIVKAATLTEKLKQYALYQVISQELLNKRDIYIAERINATLSKDELGLAFFGAIHSIVDKLAKDIEVTIIQEFKDRISIDLMNRGRQRQKYIK